MGTIAQKFNYSFEAKDLIKDSINNLGGSITSETELKEYATELDNIYDNLPKTTGEETNLSLTTIKGKMGIIPKGDIEQTQYNGYQMISLKDRTASDNGITAVISNGEITLNGTATANAFLNILLNNTYTLEVGQTYTITCNNPTHIDSNVPRFRIDETGTYDTYMSNNNAQQTITWNSGSQYTNSVYIRVASGTTLTNYKLKPMIEKGSTAHTYEPYVGGTASPNPSYPQNIEVVTGTQTITISNSDNTETQTQTLSLGDIELCKIGNYQDYLYKDNGNWYKKEYIEKIASYNGETITTDYISTTGQLTTGATIYYALETPNDIEITNTTLIEQLNNLEKLKSYNGVTNISSSGNLSAILGVSALKGE